MPPSPPLPVSPEVSGVEDSLPEGVDSLSEELSLGDGLSLLDGVLLEGSLLEGSLLELLEGSDSGGFTWLSSQSGLSLL